MKAESGDIAKWRRRKGERTGDCIYCHTSDFNITLSFVMQLHNNIITHDAGGLLFSLSSLRQQRGGTQMIYNFNFIRKE